MTVCPKCNGRGTVGYFHIDHFADIECDRCHGRGEVSEVEMTNEEWMRSATFEELAGAIYEWYSLGFTRGKNGKKLNSITEVVEWLKEEHNDSM